MKASPAPQSTALGDPTHHANAGGEPSAGCRRQSMDGFAIAAANDDARAEEADPGQDALDDAVDGLTSS
jgi:hypothetical protein